MTSNHNSRRWLVVRWLPRMGGRLPGGRYVPFRSAGWYVVRTCKCHMGVPVTVPLPSEWRAERARRAMLAASEALGT
jgi:hypothetical protein